MHYCSLVAYQIQVMSLSTYETKCSHLAEIEEKKRQSDCKQEGHQQLVIELRFHPEQHSLLFSHWGMVITFFHRSANPKIQKAHHSHNSKGYLLLFSCVKDLVLAKLGGGTIKTKTDVSADSLYLISPCWCWSRTTIDEQSYICTAIALPLR